MQVIHTIEELRRVVGKYRTEDKRIGFVPTMGALHDGHISLIEEARHHCDKIVVSIFVNPAQFAPHEDFDKYPRTEEEDLRKLVMAGVNIAYLPAREEIYPAGFDMKISTGPIGKELEGVARPHFFDGVALVVTKLFMQVQPDIAVFGEKDYQQLHIIKKLVQGLDMPVHITGAPVMREENGLAMSSRNRYLSDEQKQLASLLFKSMCEVRDKIRAGGDMKKILSDTAKKLVEKGFEKVDYLEARNAENLLPVSDLKGSVRLLAAAYLNGVRLIDNIEI